MSDANPSREPFLIQDLDTLRIIADPLRNQILELLIEQPQTVGEAAIKLGLSASKLYYHINLLEKHGLILVIETHQVGNLLEKVYRAATDRFEVDEALLNFRTETGQESVYAMMLATLDTTRDDLLRSLQARAFELEHGAAEQPRRVMINRNLANLTESQAHDLQERMCALVDEFSKTGQVQAEAAPDTHLFAMTVAFYPTFYYPSQSQTGIKE